MRTNSIFAFVSLAVYGVHASVPCKLRSSSVEVVQATLVTSSIMRDLSTTSHSSWLESSATTESSMDAEFSTNTESPASTEPSTTESSFVIESSASAESVSADTPTISTSTDIITTTSIPDTPTMYHGMSSWYEQSGGMGTCGQLNLDTALIIALPSQFHPVITSGIQPNSYCGRGVKIYNDANGKSVDVVVADTCTSCRDAQSLDLSVGAFNAIADAGDVVIPISWYFTS